MVLVVKNPVEMKEMGKDERLLFEQLGLVEW